MTENTYTCLNSIDHDYPAYKFFHDKPCERQMCGVSYLLLPRNMPRFLTVSKVGCSFRTEASEELYVNYRNKAILGISTFSIEVVGRRHICYLTELRVSCLSKAAQTLLFATWI